ncbi:MAG: M1 family aminopeptidase [Planctomycetota bacterium]|nr:M1 family aminopeptidase [Planctomycetota bacterium]
MRHALLSLILLATLSSPALAQELKFAKGRPVDLQHLDLKLDVDLKKRAIKGKALWRLAVLRDCTEIRLNAIDFKVSSIHVGTKSDTLKKVEFSNSGKALLIDCGSQRRGAKLFLEINYSLLKPRNGLHFYSPSDEDPDVPYQVWSQGEAEMNRYWIPCIDHPNERQTTEMTITVDKGLFALSNGKLMSRKDVGEKTVYHWKQNKNHVIYLVTLVVGQFEEIRDTWRGKPVTYYVPLGWKNEAMNSFKNTKRMLNFYSDKTGVEYPWDKYAQIVVEQFAHGGMENTGATTLNESTLHDKRAHIDFSSDGLVAHELAHQWFGDLITCRDWAHIWLNEGFATYFEALWDEENNGGDAFLYNMWNKAKSGKRAGVRLPIVDRSYPFPDAVFDGRAYPKGSWVLHQLRGRLGDKAFWAGIKLYVRRHQYSTVDTSDLRKAFEDATGFSLERFFYDAVERKGHPVLDVRFKWLGKEKLLQINVNQTQKEAAYHFPVTIQANNGQKQSKQLFHVTKKAEQFYIKLDKRPTLVRFDPFNKILKDIKVKKDQDWWLNQLKSDADPIGRIEAALELTPRRRNELTKALIAALESDKFWAVRVEIAKALGKIGGVAVRAALITGLKQEHAKVRRACADALGRFRKDDKAAEALLAVIQSGDKSYYVESAALASYARLKGKEAKPLLLKQLKKSSHRDTIAEAGLRGLGQLRDLKDLDLFLGMSRGPHSHRLRRTAINILGQLGALKACSKKDIEKIVKRLSECLDGDASRIRREALGALRTMGQQASVLIPVLEALADHDPSENIRKSALDSLAKVRAGKAALPEIARLQKEINQLKRDLKDTGKRLEKMQAQLEKKGRQK